jgi:hypothetical protein
MYTATIFVTVALLVSAFFYFARKRIQRRAACFALYKVRDDLICLVAEDKLDEESRVFQYYYQRANTFLSLVPKVGLDDAIESLISLKKNGDLERSIERSRRDIEDIQKLKEMQSGDVRSVVSGYYQAVLQMMIAHSSLSRVTYLHLMDSKVTPLLDRVLPKLSREFQVARFAAQESSALAPASA